LVRTHTYVPAACAGDVTVTSSVSPPRSDAVAVTAGIAEFTEVSVSVEPDIVYVPLSGAETTTVSPGASTMLTLSKNVVSVNTSVPTTAGNDAVTAPFDMVSR
jgi:hypothetical protein